MRKFMSAKRLWGSPGGPDEDWVKPHVLWLPQQDPQVLDYFGRLREVVARFPDVLTPIADEDLHMTIQSVRPHNTSGTRVDEEQLAAAAGYIQDQLDDIEPFDIQIGPARASGSAGIVEIWPEAGLAQLNQRVRTGLLAAGMDLPPAEEHFWCHMSCGYGNQDSNTPELASRSDQFASEIGKSIRPGIRASATVSVLWLVWERQEPDRNTYSFERKQPLHLRHS
ncbi:2'-5' RNA ligase family protein [Streptacidiphilus sp. MAP5-52]|uniref:2'-5' RNA ligase family protein n=1 Tax=Streptacidiphilus sp. MAP5-52 TaxID=3156267 RepID=UPI003516C7F0